MGALTFDHVAPYSQIEKFPDCASIGRKGKAAQNAILGQTEH